MRIIGTINRRIQIGYEEETNEIMISADGEFLRLQSEELNTLITCLIVMQRLPAMYAGEFLRHKYLLLWKPEVTEEDFKL